MVEAHVNDPHSDPAERALLARDGFASLLVTPVIDEGGPLGILEFSNYSTTAGPGTTSSRPARWPSTSPAPCAGSLVSPTGHA